MCLLSLSPFYRCRQCRRRRLTPICGEQIHHPPRLPHTPSSLLRTPSSPNPAPKPLRRCAALVEVDCMWCRDGRIRVGRSQIRPRVPFSARKKAVVLHSLDIFALLGVQPTMFQKHALRRNAGEEDDDKMTGLRLGSDAARRWEILQQHDAIQGKSYELVSFAAQQPDATVFEPSGSEMKPGSFSSVCNI